MLDVIEAVTGDNPTATILILHGLGADGNDFVPVAEELQLRGVGPVRYLFPHAPVMPVTINNGYRMRAWYDVFGFEDGAAQDEAGLRKSQSLVEELIARERERGIAADRIVLMGFSQGCAMALLTGLRQREKLAGIVGLSGYLPIASTTAKERSPANQKTPIFLAHGTNDEVVHFERAEASRDALQALGYPVEWHAYPMGHSVSPQEIQHLDAFLTRVLSPAGAQ